MPGFVSKVKNYLEELFDTEGIIDVDDPILEEPAIEEEPTTIKRNLSNVRQLNTHYEVVVIEPTTFNDSLEIAKNLTERKTVVLNLEMLETESSQRIVDFLAGATFALDGHQQKIGEGVFIFTPKNVNISSEQEKSKPITTEGFWNIPQQ